MGVLQVETRASLKDTEEKNLLRSILGLAAQGSMNEAEDRLYEMTAVYSFRL